MVIDDLGSVKKRRKISFTKEANGRENVLISVENLMFQNPN